MPQPQSAICPEAGAFGLFLTLTIPGPDYSTVRPLLAAIPNQTAAVAAELGEPCLVSSVAVGAALWPQIMGSPLPEGLVPFQALSDGGRHAPATPADLFIHIHSPRHDANFALARRIMDGLAPHVALVEEIHGFKNQGNRDLTGFVDGTENPQGDDRAAVALIPDGPFAGGSFVSIQRYVHQLRRWDRMAVPDQEAVIGRTKSDDQEMEDSVKPPTAHIARVVIEEDGAELEVVRHSLPYGTTAEAGLYFVAYCASPAPFRKMLEAMVLRDAEGHYDHLLDHSQPVTGAAFFAPSQDLLASLA